MCASRRVCARARPVSSRPITASICSSRACSPESGSKAPARQAGARDQSGSRGRRSLWRKKAKADRAGAEDGFWLLFDTARIADGEAPLDAAPSPSACRAARQRVMALAALAPIEETRAAALDARRGAFSSAAASRMRVATRARCCSPPAASRAADLLLEPTARSDGRRAAHSCAIMRSAARRASRCRAFSARAAFGRMISSSRRDVLDPRPDTETLIELSLDLLARASTRCAVDSRSRRRLGRDHLRAARRISAVRARSASIFRRDACAAAALNLVALRLRRARDRPARPLGACARCAFRSRRLQSALYRQRRDRDALEPEVQAP